MPFPSLTTCASILTKFSPIKTSHRMQEGSEPSSPMESLGSKLPNFSLPDEGVDSGMMHPPNPPSQDATMETVSSSESTSLPSDEIGKMNSLDLRKRKTLSSPILGKPAMGQPALKRQRPPPPLIYIRPNRYKETRGVLVVWQNEGDDESSRDEEGLEEDVICFKPHIVAMTRECLHLFIEINCPGPRTNKAIPILERKYYPYLDMGPHFNIACIKKLVIVDLQSMPIASPADSILANFRAIYSILAPQNSLHDLIYPGVIWPSSFGPLDMPHVGVQTIQEHFSEMCSNHCTLVTFVEKIRSMLTPWQWAEAESSTILLFSLVDQKLVDYRINRDLFFRVLHPTFNPLFSKSEATFLRGVCYILWASQHKSIAELVDILL